MSNVAFVNKRSKNVKSVDFQSTDFSKIFSIKDLKSDSFGHLLVCNTVEEAERMCKIRLLYDQGSLIQQFPADYMLYQVGYFNDKTGVVDGVGVAIPIRSILDLSLEIEKERKQKPVEIPEFMKGESEDAVRSEISESCDSFEDSGQSA